MEQQEQAQQQKLAQQQAKLKQQQAHLTKEQQEQAADAAKIAANKAAIAAVNKRFGELGDYNIWDEVTVYFGNDKVTVDPQYDSKLLALCKKATTVTGYVIQVKGYASAVGSAALNQKLSQERAANVTDFLDQQCHIPLTNVSGSRRHGYEQAGSFRHDRRGPGREPPRRGQGAAEQRDRGNINCYLSRELGSEHAAPFTHFRSSGIFVHQSARAASAAHAQRKYWP